MLEPITPEGLRARTGEKWQDYPADVLPAWVADMDFAVATPIRDAIVAQAARADLGYPVAFRRSGIPELFCERADSLYRWRVQPDQVDVLNDVVQGLYIGLLALSQPGDGVLIQTPIYPPFLRAPVATERRAVLCPLVRGPSGYEIDFDQLAASVDAGTRVLMFCNPHNPTGRAFLRPELEQMAAFCQSRDLMIISDEIHADLVLDDRAHIPIASLDPEVAARTYTLMSATKAFNIAGCCFAVGVAGDDALRARIERVPRHLRGGVNVLALAAVRAAWTEGGPWLDAVREQLRQNRDRVAGHAAANWDGVDHVSPEATYLAWLDCRRLNLVPDAYRFFLEQGRVALSEGANFGKAGRGFVRLNFATAPAILDQVLERMTSALNAPRGD